MATPIKLADRARSLKERVLAFLRVRTAIGGIEIGDLALRYAHWDRGTWQTIGLRLPPGIVAGGQAKNFAELVEALRELKTRITGPRGTHNRVDVVVSLSSINIYSQVFSLPMIEGENLEKAIQLNVQMVSPGEFSQTYSGWQMVGQDQKSVRLEILSAFVNRAVVDEMRRALSEAGFVVYSIESRALSLSRAIRQLGDGIDLDRSYIVVSLDANGLEFIIIRRGQLYFQYFNSWRDVEGENNQISAEALEGLIVRNLHQVLNFYRTHWTDPVSEILLSASSLGDEVAAIVGRNFPLTVRPLTLRARPAVGADWFVALGSGLRGLIPRRADRDISLLGASAQDEFRRYQLTTFGRFWRLMVPVALAVLLAALGGIDIFLRSTEQALSVQLAGMHTGEEQTRELEALKGRVKNFQTAISAIGAIQAERNSPVAAFDVVTEIFKAEGAIIKEFSFRDQGDAVRILARSTSEERILSLKKRLDQDGRFSGVNVPYSDIREEADGVSFSVSFSFKSTKTE